MLDSKRCQWESQENIVNYLFSLENWSTNNASMKKSRVNLVKLLFFFLILASNILHFQAFTFNLYSGRGAKVVVFVIAKNEHVIQKSNLFENNPNKNFLFLSSRIAREFCEIPTAEYVTLDKKKFKLYEC